MERLVTFSLFGQDFTFYSDASSEDVEKIVSLVRDEYEKDNDQERSTIPSTRMIVLGSLRIASRYVELEKEYNQFRKKQGASIDKLIDRVSTEIKLTE